MLGVLTPQQLAAAMFPLGSMTKERVREIAAERGLRRRRQAGLARHLLHPRRRHPRLPRPAARQPARAGRRRGHRRDGRASTTAPTGSPSGSGGGSAVARRRPAAPLRARHRAGEPHGDGRDGRTWPASTEVRTGAPDVDRRRRPALPFARAGAAARARGAGGLRGGRRGRRRAADRARRASSAEWPRDSPRCSTSRTPSGATGCSDRRVLGVDRPRAGTAAGLASPP